SPSDLPLASLMSALALGWAWTGPVSSDADARSAPIMISLVMEPSVLDRRTPSIAPSAPGQRNSLRDRCQRVPRCQRLSTLARCDRVASLATPLQPQGSNGKMAMKERFQRGELVTLRVYESEAEPLGRIVSVT